MTENKRYNVIPRDLEGYYGLSDNKGDSVMTNLYMGELTAEKMCNWLNEQEELINELEERNQRQYDSLKKISDLMYARDWKALESIVEDWEESDKLLQAEFGNYGGVDG